MAMSSAESKAVGADLLEEADARAVMQYVIEGTPLEPEVRRRVDERADHITKEIQRAHGNIDIEKLLGEARAEV